MTAHVDRIRTVLSRGPASARQLVENIGVSQPTVSRAIASLGDQIVRMGSARGIQYALRDVFRGLGEFPVYRVSADGKIKTLGVLVPVRPDGFVMLQVNSVQEHHEGLPWWMIDMRPQGFLGRAYAQLHSVALGLPNSVNEWSDTHALRALLTHGADAVGNLLLGDVARDRFVNAPLPSAICLEAKGNEYVRLAAGVASVGDTWSSAGGEQPKFCAFSETAHGAAHVIVKFTTADDNPVTERWRDLLLAEHLALETLRLAGVAAARSTVIDHSGQRFLEVERFDRVGATGRRGLFSLASVDAQFVGDARSPWPVVTAALVKAKVVTKEANEATALLYAFGTLIGNEDMHQGNLSFIADHGRPCDLAPAYDTLPMGFRPRTGGGLSNALQPANLHPSVSNGIWVRACAIAEMYLQRVSVEGGFSDQFKVCIAALSSHLEAAKLKIGRLG